jgi:pirin-like protein
LPQASPRAPAGTHRGFETVPYLIDGVFGYQDSNGGYGLITNGGTQWMTAGGRIVILAAQIGPLTCADEDGRRPTRAPLHQGRWRASEMRVAAAA